MEERLSPYEAGLACDADGARRILAIADEKGERLDVFAARASGETRAFVQRLIEEGAVTGPVQSARKNRGSTIKPYQSPGSNRDFARRYSTFNRL